MGEAEEAKVYFQSTFDYLFAKAKFQKERGKSLDRNDQMILQESARLLNDPDVMEKMRRLIQGRS